jgi:hypothetical protein
MVSVNVKREIQRALVPRFTIESTRSNFAGSESIDGSWVLNVPPNQWYDTGLSFQAGQAIFTNLERGFQGVYEFRIGNVYASGQLNKSLHPDGYYWVHFFQKGKIKLDDGHIILKSPENLFLYAHDRVLRIRVDRRVRLNDPVKRK